ncbi:hypothetical protein MMC32_001862 [Xylographa parallela]|nr:hypothetical protein [Xylographa parallela]
MYRNLRTFSSFSRSLFRPRPSYLQYNGPVTVRRVRVVRPIFTPSRIRILTYWTFSITAFYYVLGALDDEEEDAQGEVQSKALTATEHSGNLERQQDRDESEDDEDEEEEEEEYEDIVPDTIPEDAWFIPLGFAHQRPRTFYRGSDPEWQSFVDFAKDKKKNAQIRHELAGLVGEFIGNMRQFQKFLGAPIQTRKYWLDVDFPDGPPPEYERAGLEITDDYVAWTVRPVSSINVSRLHETLWPMATFSSFWASTQALWQLQVAKVKDFLNIKPELDTKRPRFPPGYMNLPRLAQKNEDEPTQSALPSPQVKQPEVPAPASSPMSAGSERAKILWPLPAIPKPSTEMAMVTMAFKRNLAKNWKSPSAPAPRGTFMVSGLVELQGPKGVCVMDVQAAYHPQESKWVVIVIDLRRIQKRKQGPRGGP